ncbi:hypothetical protein [Phenylobacterium sp.]|uniref:hypothetical protein n=1 Tax=Phenylobacterium sp. TaxID=1871053 RepID=UPI002F95B7AB
MSPRLQLLHRIGFYYFAGAPIAGLALLLGALALNRPYPEARAAVGVNPFEIFAYLYFWFAASGIALFAGFLAPAAAAIVYGARRHPVIRVATCTAAAGAAALLTYRLFPPGDGQFVRAPEAWHVMTVWALASAICTLAWPRAARF